MHGLDDVLNKQLKCVDVPGIVFPFSFLQEQSKSSCADWLRAMVYESIDHGNHITCHTVPVVLFLVFPEKKKLL